MKSISVFVQDETCSPMQSNGEAGLPPRGVVREREVAVPVVEAGVRTAERAGGRCGPETRPGDHDLGASDGAEEVHGGNGGRLGRGLEDRPVVRGGQQEVACQVEGDRVQADVHLQRAQGVGGHRAPEHRAGRHRQHGHVVVGGHEQVSRSIEGQALGGTETGHQSLVGVGGDRSSEHRA